MFLEVKVSIYLNRRVLVMILIKRDSQTQLQVFTGCMSEGTFSHVEISLIISKFSMLHVNSSTVTCQFKTLYIDFSKLIQN